MPSARFSVIATLALAACAQMGGSSTPAGGGMAAKTAEGIPLGATGPLVTVSGSASTAGAGPRRGRATGFLAGVGSTTVNPLPPPGFPAATPSGRFAGNNASTKSTADAAANTNRYRPSP